MRQLLAFFLVILLSASLRPSIAAAAIPDPANSTVDPCLIICPFGDFAFNVTVRDFANIPISGSTVVVDFTPVCSAPVDLCVTGCTVSGLTNLMGQVTFQIKGGGVSATQVRISADNILLASRPVASPDQDGDLDVDALDQAIAGTKLGMADPTMDLDCDQGVVDAADLSVQTQHLNHDCTVPVELSKFTIE